MSSIYPTFGATGSSSSGLPASTVSQASQGGSPLFISGLVSGINTSQVIQALMQTVEQPQLQLESQQHAIQSQIADYQAISADLAGLQSAADALSQPGALQATSATSSDTSAVAATSTGGGVDGSVSFTVQQLAAADQMASSGTVSSTAQVVTSQPSLLVSAGASALGLSSIAAGTGLSLGSHQLEVTQASQAATTTGAALSGSTTIVAGSNDTLDVTVDGVAHSITIAAGTYGTPAALASALSAAAQAQGAGITASATSQGQVVLATADQGSAATLQVTGGDALGSLGLSTMSSASAGTDAVVVLDGVSSTVSHIVAGGVLTLAGPSGSSISATVGPAASLSVGALTAQNVSTGNGSLASVVQAIDAAGAGVTAAAVQVSSGAFVLQLSSSQTGASNDVSISPSAFAASGLRTLRTLQAGQDAMISVGGAGGYSVSSSTDTISGLLPGLGVTLAQVTSAPVTVTLAPDAAGVASKVQGVVSAANQVLAAIQKYAGYNAAAKQGGPLMGNPMLNGLTQQILGAVSEAVGPGGASAAQAGLGVTSSGQLSFDSATFAQAFAADPAGIAGLLGQGGVFSPASGQAPGALSFLSATDATQPGTYAVSVSRSASQATDTGAVLTSGSVSSAETLTFGQGSTSVSYTTAAGQSLTAIASGLDSAFASGGLALSAQVVAGGQQLQVTSAAYGSAQSFTVESSAPAAGATGLGGPTASTPVTYTGQDVAGTIGGVAGVGTGQVLAAAPSGQPFAGLALTVGAAGITAPTNLGTLTYQPGLVGGLGSVAWGAANSLSGALTTTIQGLQSESQSLARQIEAYNPVIAARQQAYQNEFAQMESTMSTLKNQQSWLTSAIKQLP